MTLINMIVAFVMLIPLTKLLLSTSFYKSIIKPIPPALPKPKGHGKLIFWFIFFLSAGIACVTFIPMVDVAKILFPEATNRGL